MTWYAFKVSETTYGIFDTFEGEDGRQAHLNGAILLALSQVAGDCSPAPDIRERWRSRGQVTRGIGIRSRILDGCIYELITEVIEKQTENQ